MRTVPLELPRHQELVSQTQQCAPFFLREISEGGVFPGVVPDKQTSSHLQLPASEPEVGKDGSSEVESRASHMSHGFRSG